MTWAFTWTMIGCAACWFPNSWMKRGGVAKIEDGEQGTIHIPTTPDRNKILYHLDPHGQKSAPVPIPNRRIPYGRSGPYCHL